MQQEKSDVEHLKKQNACAYKHFILKNVLWGFVFYNVFFNYIKKPKEVFIV